MEVKYKKVAITIGILLMFALITIISNSVTSNIIKTDDNSTQKKIPFSENKIKTAADLYVEESCSQNKLPDKVCGLIENETETKKYVCLSTLIKDNYIEQPKHNGTIDCNGFVVYDYESETGKYDNGKTYLVCGVYRTDGIDDVDFYKENNNICGISTNAPSDENEGYVVTFDPNGGSLIPNQIVKENGTAVKPDMDPLKKGYEFIEWQLNGQTYNFNSTKVTSDITLVALYKRVIKFESGSDLNDNLTLIPNSIRIEDMKHNTLVLQDAIEDGYTNSMSTPTNPNVTQSEIYLPSGIFYFYPGGSTTSDVRYVIKLRSFIKIVGSGSAQTVLKPYYIPKNEAGSVNMFYFDNINTTSMKLTYRDYINVSLYDMNHDLHEIKDTYYLINTDFENFTIDGEKTSSKIYLPTCGKGFMIALYKDCDWNNIIVKNTDATGFGMDHPINSTIKNSIAYNCGKAANENSNGASGFGIGTGYSNEESIKISDCKAFNNKKFGFFFEHQSRFKKEFYLATDSNKFYVNNSIAGGNLYDFGGLKAYDVVYSNIGSVSGLNTYTVTSPVNMTVTLNENRHPIYFSYNSKNISINNANMASYLSDLTNATDEIKWALNNGILYSNNGNLFSPDEKITRFEALRSLYNYMKMPGDKIYVDGDWNSEVNYYRKYIKNQYEFGDLDSQVVSENLNIILWGASKNIIVASNTFNPDAECSRAMFITMLYRLNGSPKPTITSVPFDDVSSAKYYYKALLWAYEKGIIIGTSSTKFSPDDPVTKKTLSLMLYRYNG